MDTGPIAGPIAGRICSLVALDDRPAEFAGATLDMNFLRGSYYGATPSSLTVARTGTTAYAENSAGALLSFSANVARITDKGLLVEESRTNVCLQSQTLGTTWTTQASSVSADQTAAPDGTVTADLVTEDGTTAAHGVNQTITAASNVAYAASVYVKPNGRTWVRLFLDDSGGTNLLSGYFNCSGSGTVGTVANGGTGASAAGSIQALGNGWYRCVLRGTPSSVNTASIRFLLRVTTADNTASHAGDSASGAYFWGAQVEAAANVSSYIPTVAASATRGAETVALTGTAFSSWFNASAGTFFTEVISNNAGAVNAARAYSVSDGTTSNLIEEFYNGTSYVAQVLTATVTQASIAVAGPAVGNLVRAANRYAANDFHNCVNGTLGTADTAGTVPTVDRLHIGNTAAGTRALNGLVRRLAYFQTAQANAFLQTITATG